MPISASPIRPGEVYRLDDFCQRAGLGRAAMRAMRQRGLRVMRVGKFAFVSANDFIALLNKQDSGDTQD
jgi:hypothetical protein